MEGNSRSSRRGKGRLSRTDLSVDQVSGWHIAVPCDRLFRDHVMPKALGGACGPCHISSCAAARPGFQIISRDASDSNCHTAIAMSVRGQDGHGIEVTGESLVPQIAAHRCGSRQPFF